jgi:hypothetical protein
VDVDHGVESLGIPAAAARTVIRVASRLRIVPPAHLAGRIDPPVLTGGFLAGEPSNPRVKTRGWRIRDGSE